MGRETVGFFVYTLSWFPFESHEKSIEREREKIERERERERAKGR